MRSPRAQLFLLIVALLAVAFLYQHRHGVIARFRQLTNIKPTGRAVLEAGQPLPAFQLTTLGGQRLAVTPKPGHIMLLNVFASSCPNCQEETPALETLSKKTASMPVDIVGIDQEEDIATVGEFVQRYSLTYPIFLDNEGVTHGLLGARFIPTSFLIDSHGIIRARITGALTLAQMEQLVDETLHARPMAVDERGPGEPALH
jgi:cytochrome c biogenesis protein CcmG, thiol:disulfide interchange protein DsbE